MKHTLLLFFFLILGFASKAQQIARGIDLSVFPNPATEFISVQYDTEQISEIAVYNLLGKKVKSFEYTKDEKFYIGDLPKNMYLVQVLDHGSKVLITQKLQKR